MMINPNEHRGGGVSSTTLTSIDLLQERFRQLQKMKELRQEKELLRMLSQSADCRSSSSYTPPLPPPINNIQDINYSYEVLMPSKKVSAVVFLPPPNNYKPHNINDCQLSLSLWHDSSQYIIQRAADHNSRGIVGPPPSNVILSKSCVADAMLMKLENSSGGGGASDVDTSLRL